jgi:hypothetical protein
VVLPVSLLAVLTTIHDLLAAAAALETIGNLVIDLVAAGTLAKDRSFWIVGVIFLCEEVSLKQAGAGVHTFKSQASVEGLLQIPCSGGR